MKIADLREAAMEWTVTIESAGGWMQGVAMKIEEGFVRPEERGAALSRTLNPVIASSRSA